MKTQGLDTEAFDVLNNQKESLSALKGESLNDQTCSLKVHQASNACKKI